MTNMRKLIIDLMIIRFNKGYHEVAINIESNFITVDTPVELVEQYLQGLSDADLMMAFDDQACQFYR